MENSLFSSQVQRPLADRMRPEKLDDIVGQDQLLGEDAPLRRMIATAKVIQADTREGVVGLFDTVENRMLLPYIGTFSAGPEVTEAAGVVTFDVADATPAILYRIPTLVLIF